MMPSRFMMKRPPNKFLIDIPLDRAYVTMLYYSPELSRVVGHNRNISPPLLWKPSYRRVNQSRTEGEGFYLWLQIIASQKVRGLNTLHMYYSPTRRSVEISTTSYTVAVLSFSLCSLLQSQLITHVVSKNPFLFIYICIYICIWKPPLNYTSIDNPSRLFGDDG